MATPTKTVSNEDILELLQESMQMTSEGFDRLDNRMGGLDGRMDGLEKQYVELKVVVDKISGEQKAQANDIKDILDRLLAIEKRLPAITEAELAEMQVKLQAIIDWAQMVARKEGIPLKIG